MVVLLKRLFFVIVLLGSNASYSVQEGIGFTVNGLHNGNLRAVEDGSVLFSGDSFQLELKVNSAQYIYSFLLDSTGVVTTLDSGFKPESS